MPTLARAEDDGSSRLGVTKDSGVHRRGHGSHHVDNRHGRKHRPARRADVYLDGLVGVSSCEVQQGLDCAVGHFVVDTTGQENNSLVEQVLVHEVRCRLDHVLHDEVSIASGMKTMLLVNAPSVNHKNQRCQNKWRSAFAVASMGGGGGGGGGGGSSSNQASLAGQTRRYSQNRTPFSRLKGHPLQSFL